jgi:signal transduction histidine kinase
MKADVDIADIIAEAHSMISSHPMAGDLRFENTIAHGDMIVFGNREMLVQLVYNLFTNALNAMGGNGVISLWSESGENHDALRISDTGPGIPDEIASNVFDPFFTASKSDKGIGLGLTLCHFIMDDHDGSISLVGNGGEAGRGAEFRLVFPKR